MEEGKRSDILESKYTSLYQLSYGLEHYPQQDNALSFLDTCPFHPELPLKSSGNALGG
jgi:hypothetical protein